MLNSSRIILSAVVLASALTAQNGGKPSSAWELIRTQADKNNDGSITAEEYTRGDVRFKRLDRDGDGFLTKDDFASSSRRRGGRRGGFMDPAMMRGRMLGRILHLKDGQSMTKKQFDLWVEGLAMAKDGNLAIGKIASNMSDRRLDFLVRAFDSNDDDNVSPKELKTSFGDADRNGDGKLARSELTLGPSNGRTRRVQGKTPIKGDIAPDFELPFKTGKKTARLSSFANKMPVALIFGSYT